jgi:hypothetical protein
MWGFSHKKVSMGVAIAPARPLLALSLAPNKLENSKIRRHFFKKNLSL